VSYATARRWFESGELPVPARRAGRLVLVGDTESRGTPGVTAVYARVSSVGQEADLDRQVAWAAGEGLAVGRVVTEVGSAPDGRRRGLLGLLRDPAVTVIVVERRDGFARFGAGCVEAALPARGRRAAGSRPVGSRWEPRAGRGGNPDIAVLPAARRGQPRRAGRRRARAGRPGMTILAYRFALDPTPAQERALRSHAGRRGRRSTGVWPG
jgi:hypothetical protein